MTAKWDSGHTARFEPPEQLAATGQVITVSARSHPGGERICKKENLDPPPPPKIKSLKETETLPTRGSKLHTRELSMW